MTDPGSRESFFRNSTLIVFLAAIVLIPSILARDLWNPDEPRYMEVAREMVMLDDYVVPHLDGYIYPDKPPMFFWLAAGLYHLGFGVNSGRIIAGLASLGTILVAWRIARRVLPRPWALFVALMTFTSLLFLITSSMGVIDPLLTFFAVSAIACGLRAFRQSGLRADLWWLGAYAFVALAILTKGPVGIMVPVVALAAYGIINRKEVRGGGWIHLAGALAALMLVSAWGVPALISGGADYRNEILFSQTSRRLVRADSHQNPFYYYAMLLPAILMPWALFFFPALWLAVKQWRTERAPAVVLGLSWFLPLFIIFSVISGKRGGYILPLFPAMALLVANYFQTCEKNPPWPRLHRVLAAITLALYPLAALAVFAAYFAGTAMTRRFYPGLVAEVQAMRAGLLPWVIAGLVVILPLAWIAWRRGVKESRPRFLAAMLVVLTVLLSFLANVTLVVRFNEIKSGRTFAAAARAHLEKADARYLYRGDFSGVYNLYTGYVHLPILKKGSLTDALKGPDKVAVIAQESDLKKEPEDPLQAGRIVLKKQVGHRPMVVLTNWREETE